MENTIAHRVADFIADFAPFNLIAESDLVAIAGQVRILYYAPGEVIFKSGEPFKSHFFMVYRGAVAMHTNNKNGQDIIDQFDEGDIFGLRPLFAQENYVFEAITIEETILYAIPIDQFKPIAEKNQQVGRYLIESFASNTENPYTKDFENRFFVNGLSAEANKLEIQPVNYVRHVISVPPNLSIAKTAQIMKANQVGSVLVTEQAIPLGIVTNKSIRNFVADGLFALNDDVENIMHSPVICYPESVTIAQAQISMMKHNISYICITEDGTPNSKLLGVIGDDDILVMQANNPTTLMKAIQRAQSAKELSRIHGLIHQMIENYVFENLPLTYISQITFEFNDATIKQIIARAIAKMEKPVPCSFAWMSLGSQGRKEQILQTDQDNALIFENCRPEQIEEVRAYFLELAKKVNKGLKKVGFAYCDADIMAKNPRWCLSLEEWQSQFNQWTSETGSDELLLSSIFFDFDISFGDVQLTNALSDTVFAYGQARPLFMHKLAASALRNPSPVGFFRQFLLERSGEHKDNFDLKKRGLTPMIDAGRLLGLSHQIKNTNNTAERFQKLAKLEPENADLFYSCAYAFKAMLKFRTKSGIVNNSNGRFIPIKEMDKNERMKLKRCFTALSRVQELIAVRYQVTNFL